MSNSSTNEWDLIDFGLPVSILGYILIGVWMVLTLNQVIIRVRSLPQSYFLENPFKLNFFFVGACEDEAGAAYPFISARTANSNTARSCSTILAMHVLNGLGVVRATWSVA